MLDHHGVIDTMSFDQACQTGVDLDHCDDVTTFMCSFGKRHRRDALSTSAAYHPMVAECDGHIFTDYREGYHCDVDVYREPWMESNCVGIRGDKGQVADLMRKPVLLFDDREENIDLVRLRSSPNLYLDGVLVRRGQNADIPVPPGYLCYNDPREWVQICRRFGSAYSSDITGDGPRMLHEDNSEHGWWFSAQQMSVIDRVSLMHARKQARRRANWSETKKMENLQGYVFTGPVPTVGEVLARKRDSGKLLQTMANELDELDDALSELVGSPQSLVARYNVEDELGDVLFSWAMTEKFSYPLPSSLAARLGEVWSRAKVCLKIG